MQLEMAAMDELHNFCGRKKFTKMKLEIIHILQSPPYGNVQFILLKFEMATTSRFFKSL